MASVSAGRRLQAWLGREAVGAGCPSDGGMRPSGAAGGCAHPARRGDAPIRRGGGMRPSREGPARPSGNARGKRQAPRRAAAAGPLAGDGACACCVPAARRVRRAMTHKAYRRCMHATSLAYTPLPLSQALLSLSRIHPSPSLASSPLPLSHTLLSPSLAGSDRRPGSPRADAGPAAGDRQANDAGAATRPPPPSRLRPGCGRAGGPRGPRGAHALGVCTCVATGDTHGGYTRGSHTGDTRGTHGGYTLPVPRATASSSQRRGGGCPGVGSEGRRLARPSGPTSAPRRMLGPTRLRPAGLAAAAVPKRPGYSEAGPRWRGRASLEGQGLAGGAGPRWRGRASVAIGAGRGRGAGTPAPAPPPAAAPLARRPRSAPSQSCDI
jgi:hypothetical protein